MRRLFSIVLLLLSFGAFAQEICDNGIDDNGNGLVDLNDTTDCACDGLTNTEEIPSLIPNNSFEDMDCCPSSYSQVSCATGWIQATDATSDYMNTCGIVFGAATSAGLVPFPDGNGILGTIFSNGWQEYVGSCLLQTMVAGTTYEINFNIASTPISGQGGVCNGGNITYPPIDITIFGNPSCNEMPIGTEACPSSANPNWVVLGSTNYDPQASWSDITITFTPTQDINAVILGSPCTLPNGYGGGACYPYFYYDNLILNSTDLLATVEVNESGLYCEGNVELTAVTDTFGGSWQWYKEGVALPGETGTVLEVSGNNYGTGIYQAMYTIGPLCEIAEDTVLMPDYPTADFSATSVCADDSTHFTDLSTIPSGSIVDWDWDFGDNSGTSSEQDPGYVYGGPDTYDAKLVVTSDVGCEDSITVAVDVFENPVADFDYSDVCFGFQNDFTNTSTIINGNINAWDWQFGDGNTANQENPTHTYDTTGTFDVDLLVTTADGCADSITQVVTVYEAPTADFNFSNACMEDAVDFTDQSSVASGNISEWDWDFGDGNTSDMQSPTHTYNDHGPHTVDLEVTTDNGCLHDTSFVIDIHPLPEVDFSVAAVCLNDSSVFQNATNIATGSIDDWEWDFGDNSAIDSTENPVHTYASDGFYEVTLTATSDSGCVRDFTDTAFVNALPVADFNFTNQCTDDTISFTDASSLSSGVIDNWNWDFDDNNSSTLQNPGHAYSTAGDYEVELIVSTDAGCSDTISQTITSYPNPAADFAATTECFGDATEFTDQSNVNNAVIDQWDWDFDDTTSSTDQNPTHAYDPEGLYQVSLIVTTADNCTDTITQPVRVHPEPTADFTATSVCQEVATEFTNLSAINSGSFTNDWDFDDTNASNATDPSHTYDTAGFYNVTLTITSDSGCVDEITHEVEVFPLPVVDFEADKLDGCQPLRVNFSDLSTIATGYNLDTWLWEFGNGMTSTEENPFYLYEDDGTYTISLTVTSANGCVTNLTQNNYITVYPKPVAKFVFAPVPANLYDPTITFTDQSQGANQWHWDFGDGTTDTLQNPVHLYADSGIYEIEQIVFNEFNCSDTVYDIVDIDPIYELFIPSAFTPNADGTNDEFNAKGYGIVQYEMRIFTRWGEQIFLSHSLDEHWNGRMRNTGRDVKQDVYVYSIKVWDVFGEMHTYTGHVSLLR